MSDFWEKSVNDRAYAAQQVLQDTTFGAILQHMVDDATRVFHSGSSTEAQIMLAHADVRAVETVKLAFQRVIDAKAMADKREERSGPL